MPDMIPQRRLLILSPHYDDVPLIWGGYLHTAAREKEIRIVQIFSRSNYQVRDDAGNKDASLPRIQFATGVRLLEDLNCLDELLGRGRYRYELGGERECVLRAKPWKPGEKFEFPYGTRATFDAEDQEIFARLKQCAAEWLREAGTAILLPLGIKEHIDHVILREALIEARREIGAGTVYFGEDQPYTGLASAADWRTADELIRQLGAPALDCPIDANRKAELVMRHYPSQVEESYRKGMLERARQLGGAERMYLWEG